MKTLKHVSRKTAVPQKEVIPGRESDMTKNYAGAWAFKVDKWTALNRLLTIGSEGGTYHADERQMTLDNIKSVDACLNEDGPRVVRELVEISTRGRAPKNDQAILVLARALKYQGKGDGDGQALATRRAAERAVNKVCRIGTHIFQLAEAIEAFGGWGRLTTRAIANWYDEKTPDQIAFQATKYQQRESWSHKDLLKLSHILRNSADSSLTSTRARVYGWILDRNERVKFDNDKPAILEGFERVQAETSPSAVASLIRTYGLQRELIPTQFLNETVVWEALLEKMPIGAMIRNLGKMSSIGVLDPFSEWESHVVAQLTDGQHLRAARVHPINILIAMKTYSQGHGVRGSLTWKVNQRIVDALDTAFYEAFENIEPINKRVLVAIDKSGSMLSSASATILSAQEAAAVMAMVVVRKASNYHVIGYDAEGGYNWRRRDHSGLVELHISPKMRLDTIVASLPHDGGGTDASLPFKWLVNNNATVDAVALFSDGESWAGHNHAALAVKGYRDKFNPNTLFVTCDTIASQTQLHDNLDKLAFHSSGFDEISPVLIQRFISSN